MSRLVLLLLAVVAFTLPIPANAQQGLLTAIESKASVKETADRLVKALEDKGIKIAARVDHAAGAKSVGLDMPPAEVIMFGNPKLGTPLMLANPEIAIDLPMKMLVWQDKAGKVWVGYVAAEILKARHALTGNDEAIKAMSGALATFAKAAAGAN